MHIRFSKLKYPYLIAEISSNHLGIISNAKRLIFNAKKYGASAVKLQTFTPETMTINSNKKEFLIEDEIFNSKNLWQLYKVAQTPFSWHKELFSYAKSIGILCFSTPFDETSVDLLENLNCPFYKIASPEILHFPLINKIAKTKKSLIISTGMANLNEIDKAYSYARSKGIKDIALLYCVSNYPAEISDFNINNIKILKKEFKCKIGFSDHSLNNKIVEAAVFAGAEIIEKHIALDIKKKSLDSKFSLKGKDIMAYKKIIDDAYKLLGKNFFYRSNKEKKNIRFRRSIYAIKNIKKGEKITLNNIKSIRPGLGISPIYFNKLLNKISPFKIKAETPITKNILNKLKINL